MSLFLKIKKNVIKVQYDIYYELYDLCLKPIPGASKSITNSIFVGWTKNTGHKKCAHTYQDWGPTQSFDLNMAKDCSWSGQGKEEDWGGPIHGLRNFNLKLYWFKPKGSVYVVSTKPWNYPQQGQFNLKFFRA